VLCWVGLTVSTSAQPPSTDADAESRKHAEQIAYLKRTTPRYRQTIAAQRSRFMGLRQRVRQRELSGQNTSCSQQILGELDWIMGDTMDFARSASRMDDLEYVLTHPAEETKGEQQDSEDGGWGGCHSEWFFKVNASFDHITNPPNRKETPRYELHLLDRVNAPEKLTQYFDSVSVSDIARTGRDHARELNESLENLGRLILQGRPAYYHWDPRLRDTMMDIIMHRLRNPQTGWWGPRYVRDGKVQFVDGLSMTYHMVTTLNGNVPDLDKAMEHLIAVKDLDYPIGWLRGGKYSNHHEMDVLGLFRYGWPFMTGEQRQSAAVEIRRIVRWCLDESLRPDGSFKLTGGDSIEEETSFGASLLDQAGVFDRAKRFWTSDDFSEAPEIRTRIIGFINKHIESGGAGGTYYRHILEDLGAEGVKR
jgi:hypothetical protein